MCAWAATFRRLVTDVVQSEAQYSDRGVQYLFDPLLRAARPSWNRTVGRQRR
jgi:hypothetical protein